MHNIDFKFLTERAESLILNEMARPSLTRPEENENVAQFLSNAVKAPLKKEVSKIKGGKELSPKAFNDYLSILLYEFVFGQAAGIHAVMPHDAHAVLDAAGAVGNLAEVVFARGLLVGAEPGPVARRLNAAAAA